jgi:hypothetical protein
VALKFKLTGGDLDEFLKEEIPCKCGQCNPHDEVGILIFKVIKDMVDSYLTEPDVPNERIEWWIDMAKKIGERHEIQKLTKNINLN